MRKISLRPWVAWLVLLGLFASPACNFLSLPGKPSSGASSDDLRQTLAALPVDSFPTQTESPAPSASPQGSPLETALPSPVLPATPSPWPTYPANPGPYTSYIARSGDTLEGLAGRFDVSPGEITSEQPLPAQGYLPIGQVLAIPSKFGTEIPSQPLLPDSEVVYSPAAATFDLAGFVQQAGGFLSGYQEEVDGELLSGTAILQQVADELSVNPRLLLAFLEYRSGWVYGQPRNPQDLSQPIGFGIPGQNGLYREILITATQINVAYYGWRQGKFPNLRFSDGIVARNNPVLNPGTVAIEHLLAMFYHQDTWLAALDGPEGFLVLYRRMFGDPWTRAVEPLIPPDLAQPSLELPFPPREYWSLTSGPHLSWNSGTPRGALDFSPITGQPKCEVSIAWATAAAPGLVVRSDHNVVGLDLDGDGYEQTGLVLLYYHLADSERIGAGARVNLDDRLGHPSCEGGRATGTHFHLARKYNGEWLAADGPVPFVLGGWRAVAGERSYAGSLVRGDQVVSASPGGERGSTIVRDTP